MTTFIDTSALLAILDADDQNHASTRDAWEGLVSREESMVCTNYNISETYALVQHRLGMEAARTLQEDVLPIICVEWMDAQSHNSSVNAMLIVGRRGLSLVDCASFETKRRLGQGQAFAFDRHFGERGFQILPISG